MVFAIEGFHCIANCTSNMSPYHTFQLTTLRTSVMEHYNHASKIWQHSEMFSGYYISKIMVVITCSLIQTGVTSFLMVTNCNGCKIWSKKLHLRQPSYTKLAMYNHCFFSLYATRVITLWLKQPTIFCNFLTMRWLPWLQTS